MISPERFRSLPKALQLQALQAESRARLTQNPLQWIQRGDEQIVPLRPTRKQTEALHRAETKKIFGFFGGNRAGKSVFALFRIGALATGIPWAQWPLLPADPAKWRLGPARRIWCVTVTYEKSRDGQQAFLWERIPRAWWKDSWWKPKKGFHGNVATLTNGTTFHFKTAEQDLRTFETVALDACWVDETIPEHYFMAILPRLVDRAGPLIYTTIPDDPFIDDLFVQRRLNPAIKDVIPADKLDSVWGVPSDNPHIPQAEIETLRQMYAGDPAQLAVRIEGRFAYRRGLVYGAFTEALHLDNMNPPLPEDLFANRAEIIDPGWENPCAVLFGCVDRLGSRHCYDEIYEKHKTVGQIAAAIFLKRWTWRGLMTPREIAEYERLVETAAGGEPASTAELLSRNRDLAAIVKQWKAVKGELRPRLVLIDEYAGQHDQAKAVSLIDQLRDFGIVAQKASNRDKDAQRSKVRELLTPLNGLIRLKINSLCQWGRWEITRHRYTEPDDTTREYLGDRERVVDANNHFLSCLEYWASHPFGYTPLTAPAAPRASIAGHSAELAESGQRSEAWRRRG